MTTTARRLLSLTAAALATTIVVQLAVTASAPADPNPEPWASSRIPLDPDSTSPRFTVNISDEITNETDSKTRDAIGTALDTWSRALTGGTTLFDTTGTQRDLNPPYTRTRAITIELVDWRQLARKNATNVGWSRGAAAEIGGSCEDPCKGLTAKIRLNRTMINESWVNPLGTTEPPMAKDKLVWAVLHEVGHALGLDHAIGNDACDVMLGGVVGDPPCNGAWASKPTDAETATVKANYPGTFG